MSAPKVRKSRHKNPSGQHDVAGPSNNESGPPKRQPRRLEFDPKKPLEGKKYYLELNQPRHKAQYAKFKAELEELGAVVEQFFSKELSCVISDHVDAKDTGNPPKSKGMPSGTSPAVSTPSPFHQTRDSTPGAADSPSNNNQNSRVVTRGKAIVQKATKSQMYGTTDIFTNARNWNVPIKHLDVLLRYLNREKEKQKRLGKEKKRNGKDKQSQRGKERQLTKPFLKAEDMSRHFRPISKEFSTWPRILLDTRRGTCPYDPRTRNEASHPQEAERTLDRPDASQRTPDVRHKEPSKSQSLSKKVINKAAQQRETTALKSKAAKKGFCEFCSIKYSHLDKHLQSEQHQRLVAKKNHYVNLDTMIAVGPNLDRFLEDCVRFQHNENPPSESTSQEERLQEEDEEDEVVLLTLTPVKKDRDTKQKDSRTKTKTTSTPRKRSPALHAGKQSNKDATASQGNTSTAKDVSPQDRASLLQERLGGGDNATVCDRRISGLESPDSLPDGSNLAGPHTSDSKTAKSRKRRSGSSRSLSLPPKESVAVPTKNQGSPEGGRVVRDDRAEGLVLHGIAGEEEPIGNAGCGIEVVITRVRQVDVGMDASPVEEASNVTRNARACSPSEQLESHAVAPRDSRVCRDTPITGKSQVCEASTSSQGTRDKDAKRRSKRDSQAISSPEYRHPSRKSKRQRLAAEEVEVDDVFVESNNSGADGARKETPPLAENGNKQRDRRKRKSRKSHGEAPPRKIRGESVAADSCATNQNAVGEGTVTSPGLPEPQPRVPLTHVSHTSSDDFQPMKSPASRKSGQSAKRAKKACTGSSGTAFRDDASGGHPDVQESPVKTPNPRVPGAESSDSECQFQAKSFSIGKKSSASSSKRRRHKKSAKKKRTPVNLVTQENDQVGSAITNLSQGNRVNQEENRNYGIDRLDDNAKDNDLDKDFSTCSNEDGRVQNPPAEQSLEVVFRSDFGVEESSFLGFSQEEIEEAVSRNASLQEGRLTEKLEAAALNVYCMPSSDPNLDHDDNSSVGSFGDMTIGLVLQRVDNFPSEGSEWEEQVTGFMQKLDTQLEIKKRRESELSTLPSPTVHRALFDSQKENQMQLHTVKEGVTSGLDKDGNNDDAVFYDDIPNENVTGNQAPSNRRRSARINASLDEEQISRSMLPSRVSYSGMCFSPSKKRRTVTTAKSPNASQPAKAERSRPKQALRELSSNQIPQSPQQTTEPTQFTTPERAKRNLWVNQSSQSAQHIVFPPGTPIEEQQEILDNYVHDDSESEVVFPKFSSPPQKGSVFSPVKHWVKQKAKPRHSSVPCLGQRDVQSSPIRPNHVHGILPFGLPSSRKSLFMKGRVKRINFSSPRRRSKSFSHSPRKSRRSSFSSPGKGSPEILTFLNDLRAGLSPTFYTFKKPHFSLRILQPSAVNRRGKPKMSRSLLALNLCLPSNADLRIYEFHDDDSMEDEDLVISPIMSDTTRTEFRDRCTQTPPSRSRRRSRPRRLSMGRKASAESSASRASMKGKIQEVELTKDKKGMRSVKLQADIPEIETILDMPLDYYL